MSLLKKYKTSFLSLFYPDYCCGCGLILMSQEKNICTRCLYHLPKTNFHKDTNNTIAQRFWGRVNVEEATAFYLFQKSLRVQKILHHLKYKNKPEIGIDLGKKAGNELLGTCFETVDYITAVPLHPKKLKIRGYNQSEMIAKGIAESLCKSYLPDLLERTVDNTTQTRKNRYQRWLNAEEIFKATVGEKLENKHILLVDDVITTGATIEACVQALINTHNCKVSVFALAVA